MRTRSGRESGALAKLTSKVYSAVTIKHKPHHNLAAVKMKFADADTLEITGSATDGARRLGYSLDDIVDAVQALEAVDFIKSETAHSPKNSKVWHDTYNLPWDDRLLYLKFAGETLIDVMLVSFKKVGND